MLPTRSCVEGFTLVRVEGLEGERLAQARREAVRKGLGLRVGGWDGLDVSDLFALEQFVPERRADSHLAMVAWGPRGARSG